MDGREIPLGDCRDIANNESQAVHGPERTGPAFVSGVWRDLRVRGLGTLLFLRRGP